MQYSEDSEAGDAQRKRFRISREEEDAETGDGGLKVKKKKKKKKKNWSEQEPSSSRALEVSLCNLFDLMCRVQVSLISDDVLR